MKLYSVFDNDQWVADMTADDIAEMIGCTREQVIRAVANASVINNRYTFLNSKALNIDNYDLRTEDFEEAVGKAKEVVMREVKKIREDA